MAFKSNNRSSIRNLCCAIVLVSLFACDEQMEFTEENTTSVIYEFYDSSVPPEYHRSYDIQLYVESATVKITVDSYGDVLHYNSYEYTVGQSEELFEKLNRIDTGCKIRDPEPCSGGTGERLKVITTEEEFDFYLDHCGDNGEYPSACGEMRELIDFLKSLIPDLAKILQ